MKARLTFDLSNQEDRIDFAKCNKASGMASVLWEIEYNLKRKIEHELETMKQLPSAYEAIDMVFDAIREQLEVHNINVEEFS